MQERDLSPQGGKGKAQSSGPKYSTIPHPQPAYHSKKAIFVLGREDDRKIQKTFTL